MVAKISHNASLLGVVSYNHNKLISENAQIIFSQKIRQSDKNEYTVPSILQSFEPYLTGNKRTKKPVIHISINPHPKDTLSHETALEIIQDYLEKMGYGELPYVVYEHTDIDRKHYHIVTVCVDRYGNKINGNYEKKRSVKLCRELEKRYNLHIPTKRERSLLYQLNPVDYQKGDLHNQMKSVLEPILENFRFQSIQELATLLETYRISLEYYAINENGKKRMAVIYQCLDKNGKKTGTPVFSSTLGKQYTYKYIETICKQSKRAISKKTKEYIRNRIEKAKNECTVRTPEEFRKQMLKYKTDVIFRYTKEGKIYGATFIDYNSNTVINGSGLGKEFSGNEFETFLDGTEVIPKHTEQHPQDSPSEESIPFFYAPGMDPDEEAWKRKKKKNIPNL